MSESSKGQKAAIKEVLQPWLWAFGAINLVVALALIFALFSLPDGPQGTTGPQGVRGDLGLPGPQGLLGERGPKGDVGPPGDRGSKGDAGPAGPRGPMGVPGPVGPAGLQGLRGPKGSQGVVGDRGPRGFGVEPGTVVAFAGSNVPDGWLLCDGRAFNDGTLWNPSGKQTSGNFAQLRKAIGTTWGVGEGTDGANANLPDLRNSFLRGTSVTREVGTRQGDSVGWSGTDGKGLLLVESTSNIDTVPALNVSSSNPETLGRFRVRETPSLKAETRPANQAIHYIIKY